MPNWCENTVIVTGPEDEIKRFIDFVRSEESDFDFNRIAPIPEELKDIHVGGITIVSADGDKQYKNWRTKMVDGVEENVPVTDDEVKELKQKYGASDWYEWATDNWGTKWNTDSEDMSADIDNDMARYYFNTAWAPPFPVIQKASSLFPQLHFTLTYDEPGAGLYGSEEYQNGKVLVAN